MDLDFFIHPNWQPRIRPAGSKREWMDNTPERFAYRCLPLAIANAHGWEVGSPCGFEARWNGGSGVESVEIRVDPGTQAHQLPVSLFGQGTITFHIEAIVRTPPGWNLWVGGSPNSAKDGITPLGAVIETDWSPYTFTMNWRFTRPDHWIRFEEDEPFCFFFPVQRGVLDEVKPNFRPLEDAPELRDAFASWSASRNAFQAWVEETKPAAPADRWQKLYYRGINPDGSRGAADHQSKLRLAAPVGQGTACPVTGTPSRAASTKDPDISTATRLSSVTNQPTPAAAPRTNDGDRALRQREWLLSIAERQRELSEATAGVAWVQNLSSDEFLDHFYAPSRPALIAGEVAGWPVIERWTPEYLAQTIGNAEIEYQGGRSDSADFELNKDQHKRTLPFRRFIELATDESAGNDLYITAYNSARNTDALAPLQAELGSLDKYLTQAPGMMWIGPKGTFTPLHHDLTNNLLVQLVGTKRLHLLPPGETGKLYNHRHVFSEVHDITDPRQIQRCPLASDARAVEIVLNPGDALFIPVGWWHQVRSETFSVMMTYTNFIWPNDAYRTYPGA